jgi:hypothetical protein
MNGGPVKNLTLMLLISGVFSNFNLATRSQTVDLSQMPQCQKLRRLQGRLEPILNFQPQREENCLPLPGVDALAMDALRITAVQSIKRMAAVLIARFAGGIVTGLNPRTLSDGTLTARYTGRHGDIGRMLTDEPDSVCLAMSVGTPSAERMIEFLNSADRTYTTARVRCMVDRLQREYEARVRPMEGDDFRPARIRPDATSVQVPHSLSSPADC